MKQKELLARGAAVMIAFAAAAGLGACGKKGDLKESVKASLAAEETPDTQIHEGLKLDFDEAQWVTEELVDDYADEYPLNDYVDTYVDEERKIVNLIWPLKDEADERDGVRYGILLIKLFNDACAQQDFSKVPHGRFRREEGGLGGGSGEIAHPGHIIHPACATLRQRGHGKQGQQGIGGGGGHNGPEQHPEGFL